MTDEHEPVESGDAAPSDLPTEHVPLAESAGALDEDVPDEESAEAAPRNPPSKLIITLATVGGVLLIAIVTTLVWALASSADDDMPVPTPDASTPSLTPTPTPDPVHVPAPQPRLALTCEQLAPSGLLRSVVPEAEKLVPFDAQAKWEVSLAQVGGMSCEWTRNGRGGAYGPGESVRIEMLPNAEGDYMASFPDRIDTQYIRWDSAGDLSQLRCSVYGDYYANCNAELVVDGYWFQLFASTSTDAGSEVDLTNRAQSLLESISAAVRSAPADRPAPAPFPGAYEGAGVCSDLPRLIKSAWGWNVSLGGREGGYPSVGYLAEQRSAAQVCVSDYDEDVPFLSVSAYPSGAWSVDQLVAALPIDGRRGSWSPIELAGADAGVVACDESGCEALISYRFSRVDVAIDQIGRDKFVAGLPAFVAALG